MTAPHGLTLLPAQLAVYRDGLLLGWVFPRVVADQGGGWLVRRVGEDARSVSGRAEALRVLAGCAGCAECG